MKPIEEIEKDARWGDVVLLQFPAWVQMCVSVSGNDYAVGFYSHADKDKVCLNTFQKHAYEDNPVKEYSRRDIKAYEILRRFERDPNDRIDEVLCNMLGIEWPN